MGETCGSFPLQEVDSIKPQSGLLDRLYTSVIALSNSSTKIPKKGIKE